MEWLNQILNYPLFKVANFTVTLFNFLWVFVIIIVTRLVLKFVEKFLNNKLAHLDKGRTYSLFSIIKYFLWLIAALMILQTVGVNLSLLLAGSAALFVGLGFGLQNIFNDFISGIILLIEGTIEVDDVVEVDGVVGKVKEIKLRTTKILTRDDIILIKPNHKFISDTVINWSHHKKSTRFKISVGVAYGSDVRLVEKCLLAAANTFDQVDKHPAPVVLFDDFGDSSLDFNLYFWSEEVFTAPRLRSNIRYKIDALFREHNITIPFPQRDVHIFNTK